MSSQESRRYQLNSAPKEQRHQNQESTFKKKLNNEFDSSCHFPSKYEIENVSDINQSLYSIKNSFTQLDKPQSKIGSILLEDEQIAICDTNTLKNIIQKEKKSPTDIRNMGNALKYFWFFDDYKKNLPFSNYLSLLKSIEYQFVKKGEIVYSIGQKSTDMYVILEGSFFVLIRNPKSLIVYNTPKASQFQSEQNSQQNNNQPSQFSQIQQPSQQQQLQQQQEVQRDSSVSSKDKDSRNVEFSQAWEYIEKQTLQDEINRKMQSNGPLEWYEICEELSDTILVDSLKLGNNFGEFELMYNRLRSQIIVAREDSHLIKISQQQYEFLPKEKNARQYNSQIEFLYRFDFFNDWSRQMMNLLVCFEICECYLNQVIYSESEESEYLYFVYSGEFEITKKIDDDESQKKVLELANIPLYNYKKNIKSQIKPVQNYSERVRLCLYGPNTYFGDEELLHLEKRQTQATCVSQEGVLYKLSLKKLVKIVCNQNNIWEMLQENLRKKKKWQKQFFSQLNEEYRIKKLNQSMNFNQQSRSQSPCGQLPDFLQNVRFQSRPHYKGFKDNFSHNILNVNNDTTNNILSLHKKKSNSPKPKTTVSNSQQKNENQNLNLKNMQQGTNQFIFLENYEDNYVTQNSPIQTTRYFNLKQELLNRQFFIERSRNLIEVQQNVDIAKRFKDYQKNLKRLEIIQNQQKTSSENNQKIKKKQSPTNDSKLSTLDQQTQKKKKELLLSSDEKNSSSPNKQQSPRKTSISRNRQSEDYKNKKSRLQSPKNKAQMQETKRQNDKNSFIRKDDPYDFNPNLNRNSSENGIKIDLRIYHENINEQCANLKKDLWDELSSSKEKITTQKFYDQLMDALYGDKRPCTVIDLKSKTFYKNSRKRNINNSKQTKLNKSLNCSNISYAFAENSLEIKDKTSTQLQSPSRQSTPVKEMNPFRSYYNQNKDKQNLLDKLRFHRLMRPQIDECAKQDRSESQTDTSFFTTQVQFSPIKLPSGSMTSRDNKISQSIQTQNYFSSQKNSQIFDLQADLLKNLCKTQVLKQQQFPILGKQNKQSISQSYHESIDFNNQASISSQNKSTVVQNDIQQDSNIIKDQSLEKQYQHFDQQQFSQKIESCINNKLNIRNQNRLYKEGDNIYIKTGGFTIKRPCPLRFVNQA